ncbi:MAG: peptidoglycan D,D-transpeptidase FtsI family protein [Porcipelethomonas sp.]
MLKRLTVLSVVFMFLFSALYLRLFAVVQNKEYISAGQQQGTYTVETGRTNGNIYDRNMNLLVNRDYEYYAVVNPTSEAVEEILPCVTDKDGFYSNMVYGKPFLCEVKKDGFDSQDITVFKVPVRYGEESIAHHITGYVSDGEGICGIEYAYDEFLRSCETVNSVTYNVNGCGKALEGIQKEVSYGEEMKSGVVLTIDYYIQAICELAGRNIEKGAVVVMDIYTGDILAMASFPDYDVNELEDALDNENSPLINRCLYSYSVGSIFKLVTAEAAFEQGINEDFSYSCEGFTEINDQIFRCHDLSGHGMQNMTEAMANSCNTYFIELSKHIDSDLLLETARRMGFGMSIPLASGMTASGGNLQSEEDLLLPAEKANLSFGQGKLLASPVQICAFTCAIANEGNYCVPRLVKGTTFDGENISVENPEKKTKVMERDTAFRLQDLMIAAVDKNESSAARPKNNHAAGKTSTAQTGRFDEEGTEICHGWITGFFPLSSPEYAVTVLCEDGGYGNDCAAPVFKEIIERMTDINY